MAKKIALFKGIHATLRNNGYTRQKWGSHGAKVYKTIPLPTSVVVKIPGNWSLVVREFYIKDLLETLSFFNPHVHDGTTGVEIYFDEQKWLTS